jgi:protein-disulfide isomerase-like protein with CxxC motif
MDNKTKHTPTPWIAKELHANYTGSVLLFNTFGGLRRVDVTKDGSFLNADAELIVRAVNSHEELLDIVKRINYAFYVEGNTKAMKVVMTETKAIIAKAEGK